MHIANCHWTYFTKLFFKPQLHLYLTQSLCITSTYATPPNSTTTTTPNIIHAPHPLHNITPHNTSIPPTNTPNLLPIITPTPPLITITSNYIIPPPHLYTVTPTHTNRKGFPSTTEDRLTPTGRAFRIQRKTDSHQQEGLSEYNGRQTHTNRKGFPNTTERRLTLIGRASLIQRKADSHQQEGLPVYTGSQSSHQWKVEHRITGLENDG
jgi:hypothetical protein